MVSSLSLSRWLASRVPLQTFEFVLSLSRSLLPQVVPLYHANVPPSVVSPLLTEGALQLLGQTTRTEEKMLWASLGDSWNTPRYHSTPRGLVRLGQRE